MHSFFEHENANYLLGPNCLDTKSSGERAVYAAAQPDNNSRATRRSEYSSNEFDYARNGSLRVKGKPLLDLVSSLYRFRVLDQGWHWLNCRVDNANCIGWCMRR